YGSTSDHPDDLVGDEGGADWNRALIKGAIDGGHIDEAQYQKAGKGFENPRNGGGVAEVPGAMVGRDHLDAPWEGIEWPKAVKNQPGDEKNDPRASYARAKKSCAVECYDGDDEQSWYGSPDGKRQG